MIPAPQRFCATPLKLEFFDLLPVCSLYAERVPCYEPHYDAGRRRVFLASLGWGFWHVQFTLFV